MAVKVSTLQIRQKLGDLLNRVALRQDEFIIERKGLPLAALDPVERLDQMREAARLHLLSVMRTPGRTKLSQKQVDSLADEAKHLSRKKKLR